MPQGVQVTSGILWRGTGVFALLELGLLFLLARHVHVSQWRWRTVDRVESAMYIHRMHRTQLYLDTELHARLKALARRRGRTLSELVREALVQVYGPTDIEEQIKTTKAIAGLWRDREDLGEATPSGYAAHADLTGVVLDSNIIIEILRGRRAVVEADLALGRAGVRVYCTAVSWAEVYAGMRPGEETAIRSFFDARGEVVLDARIGRHAGGYLARYAKSHGVEIADALVAAAAATSGLRLWTLNRKHYPMEDLQFYQPSRARS